MANAQSRSEREREIYNTGLQRARYHDAIRYSKHWPSKARQSRAADIFRMYDSRGPVLEIGSRMWYVWIEMNGLFKENITCVNISESELQDGANLAAKANNKPKFELGDAHDLPYDDATFDVIFGTGVLHHLELERALGEMRRLLKPGGMILFGEPLDLNPVGRVVRQMTPQARTEDERPFRMRDFELLERYFDCSYSFEEMLSVPAGALAALVRAPVDNQMGKAVYRADRMIGRMPAVKYWCRTVFLEGRVPVQ